MKNTVDKAVEIFLKEAYSENSQKYTWEESKRKI